MKNDFYVYMLCYPSGKPFYIGKGRGNRIKSHEKETKRGGKSKKCTIIRSIWQSGQGILRILVKENCTEFESLIIEAKLIRHIGLENLTNSQYGYERLVSIPINKPDGRQGVYRKSIFDLDDNELRILIARHEAESDRQMNLAERYKYILKMNKENIEKEAQEKTKNMN